MTMSWRRLNNIDHNACATLRSRCPCRCRRRMLLQHCTAGSMLMLMLMLAQTVHGAANGTQPQTELQEAAEAVPRAQCPSFAENSACPCYKFEDGEYKFLSLVVCFVDDERLKCMLSKICPNHFHCSLIRNILCRYMLIGFFGRCDFHQKFTINSQAILLASNQPPPPNHPFIHPTPSKTIRIQDRRLALNGRSTRHQKHRQQFTLVAQFL